jgi:hypothetical protein
MIVSMKVTTARVSNGRVIADADPIPDGKLVKVVLLEEEPVHLTDAEKEWLRASIAESKGGEATDALEFLAELEQEA